MGRGGSPNPVGLPHHALVHHQRNVVQFSVWDRRMIPVEIQENSSRFQNFVAEESNEGRKVNLDLLDEVREQERVKSEALERRVELKQKTKVRPRQFQVADLVMRKAHPY